MGFRRTEGDTVPFGGKRCFGWDFGEKTPSWEGGEGAGMDFPGKPWLPHPWEEQPGTMEGHPGHYI